MRCHLFFGIKLLATGALLAWCQSTVASPAEWPVSPSRLVLSSSYGTLRVKTTDYIYESHLLLDGKEVQPNMVGLLNIPYAFALPGKLSALISVNTGSSLCPVQYRWVTLYKGGYNVSKPFGSCSSQIRVSAIGRRFELATPSNVTPNKVDVYVYDGRNIKQRVR
ncbi:hypothetical protein KVP10_20615 [Candidimonas humi]|jgi:hypothetical protein|uniref:Uncharacterized protein n=1 Tax=Candidimonas humi TaxID=683355 RepID=A0ABV8P5Q4_9BURK|nr:hypothetical protein [Candidimonas humi]MBV6307300.1 hypothetical protein [Candidimonas humi]